MDNTKISLPARLFTDIPAFRQYLKDVKSEGMMNRRERKKMFDKQHTHGMAMNFLMELQLSITKSNPI